MSSKHFDAEYHALLEDSPAHENDDYATNSTPRAERLASFTRILVVVQLLVIVMLLAFVLFLVSSKPAVVEFVSQPHLYCNVILPQPPSIGC
jgi:hypothetical protein